MLNKIQEVGLKVASPIGTLCGQVFFGWLADRIGRKRACRSIKYNDLMTHSSSKYC